MNTPNWRNDANCLGEDPDLFFLADGDGNASTGYNQQVIATYCHACPVKAACLADTLAWEVGKNYAHGVAGGMTPSARFRLTLDERADLIEAGGGDATAIRRYLDARPTERHEPACGTYSGYSQHRKNKSKICGPCREAGLEYQRQYRARQRQAVPA